MPAGRPATLPSRGRHTPRAHRASRCARTPPGAAAKRPALKKRPPLRGRSVSPSPRWRPASAPSFPPPLGARAGPPGPGWAPRLRRGLTRHRDTRHDRCRGQGGGRPRAGGGGQARRAPRRQRCSASPVRFPLGPRRGEGEPTRAPQAHGPTRAGPLACHRAVVGASLQRHKALGAPPHTLGSGLTTCDLLHAGPGSGRAHTGGGDRGGRGIGGRHTGFLSSECCHIWPIGYHISTCTNTSAKLH